MTERTGTVIVSFGWLMGCVVVGVLCFWYPSYVDSKFAEDTDSRMGFFFMGTMPFMVGAGVVAVFSLIRLFRALRGVGAGTFTLLSVFGDYSYTGVSESSGAAWLSPDIRDVTDAGYGGSRMSKQLNNLLQPTPSRAVVWNIHLSLDLTQLSVSCTP